MGRLSGQTFAECDEEEVAKSEACFGSSRLKVYPIFCDFLLSELKWYPAPKVDLMTELDTWGSLLTLGIDVVCLSIGKI
jgi:hypothetical protein